MVVSNTSPLCYLVWIDAVKILPTLFGEINTTRAVVAELTHNEAPEPVRAYFLEPPGWLRIHENPPDVRPAFKALHAGEATALEIAAVAGAELILLDELAARRAAADASLKVAGTLGVLKAAAVSGLIDLPTILRRLKQTSFRASPDLWRHFHVS